MADIITIQELVDARLDAATLEQAVNGEAETKVTSRLGRQYWTLATLDALIADGLLKINDLQDAIDIAAAAGAGANGWTAELVVDGNQTQKQINADIRNKIARYPTILDFFTSSELVAFKLNPNMDCTSIIKRAFATGVKKLNFLDLQMRITKALLVEDPLATFTSGDIELYGNGATFIDDTVYTDVSNPSFNSLFILDGGVNSFNSNINYIGKPVNLNTKLGYIGATYVFSKRENKNIHIDAYMENIRYGILCGNYALPDLGGTKGVRGWLRCKNVGYPIASYLADDIELTITGDGFHRVHYIAGCNHARINTWTKNYYIAPIAHLYSDAKTGGGTSKGCVDCRTEAHDQGSTQYVTNSYLLGLSLSRVDPNTVYDSVTMIGHVKSKNGVAEKLGLGTIVSSVRTVQPSYPANWESSIYLNNITIKGIIDRREQTTEEHGFSDLYLSCVDDVSVAGERHAPTIRNLNIDVDYFAGSGNKPRGFLWFLDGLQDIANVRLNAKNSGINVIRSNPNSLIKFKDSLIVGIDANNSASLNSKMEFINSFISDATQLPTVNKRFINTPIAGVYPQGTQITTTSNTLTLSGASVSWVNALPNNALILGVSFVITENITGSTGLLIGVTGTPNKYYSSAAVTAGSGLSNANSQTGSLPHNQLGTGSIVVTARDSGGGTSATFTGGKVKVVLNYIELPIPS